MHNKRVVIAHPNAGSLAARLQKSIEEGSLTCEQVFEAMDQQQERIRQLELESGRNRKDRRKMGRALGEKSPAQLMQDRARLKRMLGK